MSQTTKFHKITVKNKVSDQISTGLNTEIFLDGKKLEGITFAKFEFKPRKLSKVVIEMCADVEIEESIFEDVVIK